MFTNIEFFICENNLCEEHNVFSDEEWMDFRERNPAGFILTKDCPKLKEFSEKYNAVEADESENLICFLGIGIF